MAAAESDEAKQKPVKKKKKAPTRSRYSSFPAMVQLRFSPDGKLNMDAWMCPDMEPTVGTKTSLGICSPVGCGVDSKMLSAHMCAHRLRSFAMDQSIADYAFIRMQNLPHKNWLEAFSAGCHWLSPAPFRTTHIDDVKIVNIPFRLFNGEYLSEVIKIIEANANNVSFQATREDLFKITGDGEVSKNSNVSHDWYIINATISNLDTNVPFDMGVCMTTTVFADNADTKVAPTAISREWHNDNGETTTPVVGMKYMSDGTVLRSSVDTFRGDTHMLTPVNKCNIASTAIFSASCDVVDPWVMRALSMDFPALIAYAESTKLTGLESFINIAAPDENILTLRSGRYETDDSKDSEVVVLQWLLLRFSDYFNQEVATWYDSAETTKDEKLAYKSMMKDLDASPEDPKYILKTKGEARWFIVTLSSMISLLREIQKHAKHDLALANLNRIGTRFKFMIGEQGLTEAKARIANGRARGESATAYDPAIKLSGLLSIVYVPWKTPTSIRLKQSPPKATDADIATAQKAFELIPPSTAGKPAFKSTYPR